MRTLRSAWALLPGPDHLDAGRPCQDACAVLERPGLRVFALADGVGSAPRSQEGAAVAVAAAAQYMVLRQAEAGDPQLPAQAARAAARTLERRALRLGLQPEDLACTLHCGLMDESGAWVAGLGDGGMLFMVGGAVQIAVDPGPDKLGGGNTTWTLADPGWEARLRLAQCREPELEGLLAVSDGLQSLFFAADEEAGRWQPRGRHPQAPGRPSHAEYFLHPEADWWAGGGQRALADYLRGEYQRADFGDDKSLVLLRAEGRP